MTQQTTTYDYTQLADNDPLPFGMGFGILSDDGATESIVSEPDPDSFFFAQSGRALFNFTTAVAGPVTDIQGYWSSLGILESLDQELSIIFSNPREFFNSSLDAFTVQIGLGTRSSNRTKKWTGALITTDFTQGGGFSPEWKLALVEVDGSTITEITSTTAGDYLETNELIVSLEAENLKASFNGSTILEGKTSSLLGDQTVLIIRVTTTSGATVTPHPVLLKATISSLLTGYKDKKSSFPTHYVPPVYDGCQTILVPVAQLCKDKKLKRLSDNAWEFTEDVLVEVDQANDFLASA